MAVFLPLGKQPILLDVEANTHNDLLVEIGVSPGIVASCARIGG